MKPTRTADDYDPEVLTAFDAYVHGGIDRREFMQRLGSMALRGMTAGAVFSSLAPQYATAAEVAADDPALLVESLTYTSPQSWNGYLARPKGVTGKLPGMVVIHENRGRNPYVEDVARRLGKSGYLALAPDALTSFGGWPGNDDDGRALQRKLDRAEMFANFEAAVRWLGQHPACTGKVGAIGFCYGGGVVNQLAVSMPELAAGVPFYGRHAPTKDVPRIQAPLQIHSGSLDTRLLAGLPEYEQALIKAKKQFDSHIYEGAHHGFHNNTTPRYNEKAATLAWTRTLDFLSQHLG